VHASNEPEETLFVADEQRMATEILKQAFDFAYAAAALVPGATVKPEPAAAGGGHLAALTELDQLMQRRDQLQAMLGSIKSATDQLRHQLTGAKRQSRDGLKRAIAAQQAQADLVQSRIDTLATLIEFEIRSGATSTSAIGLEAQIEELQRSMAQSATPNQGAAKAAPTTVLPGNLERLLAIRQREQALGNAIELTDVLSQTTEHLRQNFIVALQDIDREGLSKAGSLDTADVTALKQSSTQFEALASGSKAIGNAVQPLAKQLVLLKLYSSNLSRWQADVRRQFNKELRREIFHAISVAAVFGIVFIAAGIWRRLTFRYVEDVQRREKLLQLRRFVLIATLAVMFLFGFTSELGTLATVMGFAAAGIALALQNVILSMAGYFYLSGRFGIRIGDRVEIAGITGDVLESGFFKLTLVELSNEQRGRMPTGRAVIFPNSVVFQPNSNFFRQLPGTSFVWNELRLTLAPDCDYRQAEKLVTEVVNEVYAHYRDVVQREYRAMESRLNLRIDTPRPQSRLQFGEAGLELVVRYPTRLSATMQTADEVTRRLVDAINREPRLKLAVPGVPAIQAAIETTSDAEKEPRLARAPSS
jgi:small-conductance mechanosensitive channel